MDILKTKDLSFKYDKSKSDNEILSLKNINLSIKEGSFVTILGHNGSGKSTLAKHFNALLTPTLGDVLVCGFNTKDDNHLWEVRQTCGMVFQNPDNQIVATIVEEDIAFGLENLGIDPAEIEERVSVALQSLGMESYRKEVTATLSGGQKQRIAIAGILAMRPKCIVFDEPTAMLDPIGRLEVLQAIKQLLKEGITVILITHFMDEVILSDRVIIMQNGEIALDNVPKKIFNDINKVKLLGLALPQITEVAYNLYNKGIEIPTNILTIQEMVDFLIKRVPNGSSQIIENNSNNLLAIENVHKIIKVEGLNYVYNSNTPLKKMALKNINIEINKGDFVGIIGHTGSGKSTLVQHLIGLLKPTSGKVLFNNEDINKDKATIKAIRQKIGLVFQYPEHQLFEETVYKDVAFGPKNMGLSEEDVHRRVCNALSLVDVPEQYFNKSPFEISGGQKRRVAIAGILAMEPEVLVLDEPTAGLDSQASYEILKHILTIHKKTNNTVIIISHSMEDIARLVDKLIVLNEGEVKYTGTPRQVFKNTEDLEKIGLAVPKISYLVKKLAKYKVLIKEDILTVDEATEEIYNLLKKL